MFVRTGTPPKHPFLYLRLHLKSRIQASHSQVLFNGHNGRVVSLVVSPCGRFVATGQEEKNASAIVWDPATGHVRYSSTRGVFLIRRALKAMLLNTRHSARQCPLKPPPRI